jgi:TolB-like protein
MKDRKSFLVLALCAVTNLVYAQQAASLDDAIKSGAREIENKLARGVKVVVLNFNAPSERLSNYVLDELMTALVSGGKITVVDRQNLALIQQEMNFQMSGEVSDESAQAIGKKLGAQSIISGSLEDMGGSYRIRFRTIEVVSAAIQALSSDNVRKDDARILSMLPQQKKSAGGKIGDGFMNSIFGLGSYLDGDIAGGITITSGYVVAAGLLVVEATVLDWDSPAVGVPGTIGFAIGGATIIYGFLRPFIYNRSPKAVAMMDNMHLDIVPVSHTDYRIAKNSDFRLSYSITF